MGGLSIATASQVDANSGLAPSSEISTFEPTNPAPTPGEVAAILFPSDAGGVGYLFGHDLTDAVPTPLEEPPTASPDPAANAIGAIGADAAANVYSTHAGTPLGGPVDPATAEFDVTQASEQPAEALAAPSANPSVSLTRVLRNEWTRVTTQLRSLGSTNSTPNGGANG